MDDDVIVDYFFSETSVKCMTHNHTISVVKQILRCKPVYKFNTDTNVILT